MRHVQACRRSSLAVHHRTAPPCQLSGQFDRFGSMLQRAAAFAGNQKWTREPCLLQYPETAARDWPLFSCEEQRSGPAVALALLRNKAILNPQEMLLQCVPTPVKRAARSSMSQVLSLARSVTALHRSVSSIDNLIALVCWEPSLDSGSSDCLPAHRKLLPQYSLSKHPTPAVASRVGRLGNMAERHP